MPISIDQLCQTLAALAPLRLAESWDNVGLLVGDRTRPANRVMTCLTISPSVVREAVEQSADLIVTHHPLPFKPLQRLTTDSVAGRLLLELIQAKVAIYSAHTAYDSAASGINQQWASALGLQRVEPLEPAEPNESSAAIAASAVGSGRYGRLEQSLELPELASRVAGISGASSARYVGPPNQQVTKIAFACGSGGSFLDAAIRKGCDALVTGEATFHTCLDAESRGLGLVLLGHYASERFAMEAMAAELAEQHPDLTVWPSANESDPIRTL